MELHSNGDTITYFDNLEVEHIPSKDLRSEKIFLEYKLMIK